MSLVRWMKKRTRRKDHQGYDQDDDNGVEDESAEGWNNIMQGQGEIKEREREWILVLENWSQV